MMKSILFINKLTGEPKTSLKLGELSQYRRATADEQERYEQATADLSKREVAYILKKQFNN